MIRKMILAVLAALTLAGLAAPAMAGTHHIRPQLVAPGTRHAIDCTWTGKHNTDGLTFFSVAIHPGSGNCWYSFRGKAKCVIGHSTSKIDVYGPWTSLTPGSSWSRANCPNGDTLYKGGFELAADGTGAVSTVWLWPSSSAVTTATAQRTACTQTSDGDMNQSAGWGEVDWESVGCPGEWLIRARLLCASRFGGTVYSYSGQVESNEFEAKAQCPSDHSQLQVFWQQFNINGGSWSTCEYYPTRTCPGALKRHWRLAA